MNLRFSRRGVPQIGGFHHDYLQAIEKSGVFEFANKVMYKNGFYEATLFYQGNKVKDITFFPIHWSREKVVRSIFEAYDDFLEKGACALHETSGKKYITGFTKGGVEVEMFVTMKGRIATVYPIFK